MALRKTIFGRLKYKPNTFIGGVSATLNTPALVATKLGLSESRIKGFKIIGSDIKFAVIGGTYGIPSLAFGSSISANANKNITYYYDNDGLVSTLSNYCFKYCSAFTDFKFSANLTSIGNGAFSYTSIVNADLSYISASITGEWGGALAFCPELVTADTGLIGTTGTASAAMFRSCVKLVSVSTKIKYYAQMFRSAGLVGGNFYNAYVLELRGYSFYGTGFYTVGLPNCVKFSNEEFYLTTQIREVIAIKVTSVGLASSGACFRGCSNMTLVDIRACKNIINNGTGSGNYNFRDIKIGVLVKVHVFMLTSNGGTADPELLYIKNTRGGTVEFYDDFGNYVSTL